MMGGGMGGMPGMGGMGGMGGMDMASLAQVGDRHGWSNSMCCYGYLCC